MTEERAASALECFDPVPLSLSVFKHLTYPVILGLEALGALGVIMDLHWDKVWVRQETGVLAPLHLLSREPSHDTRARITPVDQKPAIAAVDGGGGENPFTPLEHVLE